jgi:hypothetical protein
MAQIKIKAIIGVDMPEPKQGIEKLTTKERNEELRQHATEVILDALNMADLNPEVIRLNLSRTSKLKGETNE